MKFFGSKKADKDVPANDASVVDETAKDASEVVEKAVEETTEETVEKAVEEPVVEAVVEEEPRRRSRMCKNALKNESAAASSDKKSRKNRHHGHNGNRISYGIGTAIIILLAFSCVVGADSFLTENSGTEGENYDMVTPDYYAPTQNDVAGGISNQSETIEVVENKEETETTVSETTVPPTTEMSIEETTTVPDVTEPLDPTAETSAPAEPLDPTATPKPTHVPTPTATPMPTPTPKPEWTETPYSDIVYATGEVNVRKGPGTEFEITKTLKLGDPIEVVAKTSNEWFKTIKGTYVKCSLCTAYKPSTPTPVPTKAPTPKPKATPTPKPKKNADPTPKPKATPTPKPSNNESGGGNKEGMTLVGSDFKITFYGPDWAGPGTDNRTTATRTTCVEGRTVAADWGVLPAGTKIYIENDPLGGDGYYVVEDKGGGVDGHHIDIFAENGESMHTKYNYKVYIVN